MFRVILAFFCLCTSAAQADSIVRLPMQEVPVGTVLLYRMPSGEVQSRRVTVNSGQRLEVAVSKSSPQRLLKHTLVFDADGLTRKVVYPSGREITFDPHNCYRVIGICSYTITDAAKQTFRRTNRSTFADGRLTIEVTDRFGKVLENRQIDFDENGMALRFILKRGEAEPRSMTLLQVIRPDGSEYPVGTP